MGICLDTGKIPDDKNFKNGSNDRQNWEADDTDGMHRDDNGMSTHNNGHVKFDTPKVPVIFVLGGPGSGKVTHCDNLMIEKRGIVHINMTDLLQQYTVGNELDDSTLPFLISLKCDVPISDMEDFSKLSSKTVTEVLMLELKMSPAAKTFLISGFPRNMRDTVEYTNKIKVVNGVILISWNQNVLERQIDYGAKLGHVVLSLARMELNNFYKNVTPVSDFYDQKGMLISVNGERSPTEVYNDFRSSVLQILSAYQTPRPVVIPNGAPSHRLIEANDDIAAEASVGPATIPDVGVERNPGSNRRFGGHQEPQPYPRVICVVGGPGSNKSLLCQRVLRANANWGHVSMGPILRTLATSQEPLQETISSGQIVGDSIVHEVLDNELRKYKFSNGIVIDGYPRNIEQLNYFEKKYAQRPNLILLDCSKLQLGRGRLDDSVSAFRRRLECFREQTLPMLKALDRDDRLAVVDGNTEDKGVQEKFIGVLMETMRGENFPTDQLPREVDLDDPHPGDGTVLQDLEDPSESAGVVEGPLSKLVAGPALPRQNGYIPNADGRDKNDADRSNDKRGRNLRYDVRNMYAQIGSYPSGSKS